MDESRIVMEKTVSQTSEHWNNFYSADKVSANPSDFAKFVDEYLPQHRGVVEFGCGNGRDSVYFAQRGRHVYAFDYCATAILKSRKLAKERGIETLAQFKEVDVVNSDEILEVISSFIRRNNPIVYYARFFLHSIDEVRESSLFSIVNAAMLPGDALCLEFRTNKDEDNYKAYGEHFRRYLQPDAIVGKCAAFGLTVGFRIEGENLSVFGHENPHLARMVFVRS